MLIFQCVSQKDQHWVRKGDILLVVLFSGLFFFCYPHLSHYIYGCNVLL